MEQNIHIILDRNVDNKFDIFDIYSEEMNFPPYFGKNWDAFVDCLSDFLFDHKGQIIVEHTSNFSIEKREYEIYRSILTDISDKNFLVIWN